MKKRFIHIGYPKCGSTALQSDYFGYHPEIYFLGVGVNNGKPFPEKYLDEQLAVAFEMDLRYRKEFLIEYDKLNELFTNHFEAAELNSDKKVVLASNEILSFTYSIDTDVNQKADRLLRLFGKDTGIIIFIRNQKELIRSMYSEFIRGGSYLTFEEFIDYNLLNDYRFFFSDLLYDKVISVYEERFGKENIHILIFDEYKENFNRAAEKICEIMSINYHDKEIGRKNSSLKKENLSYVLDYNFKNRHNFGKSIHEGSQMQRLYPFLKLEKGNVYPDKIREDHEHRKTVNSIDLSPEKYINSQKKSFLKPKIETLFKGANYDWNAKQEKKVEEYYAISNGRLSEKYKLDLKKWNYPIA